MENSQQKKNPTNQKSLQLFWYKNPNSQSKAEPARWVDNGSSERLPTPCLLRCETGFFKKSIVNDSEKQEQEAAGCWVHLSCKWLRRRWWGACWHRGKGKIYTEKLANRNWCQPWNEGSIPCWKQTAALLGSADPPLVSKCVIAKIQILSTASRMSQEGGIQQQNQL